MSITRRITLPDAKTQGQQWAKRLKGGEIFALIGPLGAGKTTFTQALGKALKVKRRITSPTFLMMQQFPARLQNGRAVKLYHLDLYRTKNFLDTESLGITQEWGKPDTVTVMEWADRIIRRLPKKTIKIYFSHPPRP